MKQAQKARKVEPIRRKVDIERIKTNLADQPRNLALFVFGINTNLRASDIVRITVDQVKGIKPGETIELIEKKTKKPRCITINPGTADVIRRWIKKRGNEPGPLFLSQRMTGRAICVSSVHRLVKAWCAQINLRGNYGSHTLRKTWGYQVWRAGIDLPRIMIIFNHATQKQTLQYLCIQEKEIQEVYLKVEL
ncbi:MAG: Tyrosine recombinase XerC [Candidatus Methanogaster sp.]|nr:MAG: Tyrosine recombinase XerC [ANME-2 cluster archaeon]